MSTWMIRRIISLDQDKITRVKKKEIMCQSTKEQNSNFSQIPSKVRVKREEKQQKHKKFEGILFFKINK